MKNKKIKKFLLLFLVLTLCAGLCQCVGKNSKKYDRPKIYLITKSKNSNFWKSVYAGASAASAEYNLDLFHEGPDNEEDYITQNKMIDQAVQDKAEAIVLSAVDYEANAKAVERAAKAGVKIVVIDSDVRSDCVKCRIGTDNYEAGRIAARAAIKAAGENCKIGILNFDKITENGQSREKGFRETLAQYKDVKVVDAVNIASSSQLAKEETKKMLERNPDIDVLVAFNEILSVGAGEAIEETSSQDQTTVVAFDSNVSCIDHLEAGNIDALVVQNPYAMGYLAVETVDHILSEKKIQKNIDTSVTLITKENMYDEEYQKILFAFGEN